MRELINVIRAVVALHDGETVESHMLPPLQARARGEAPAAVQPDPPALASAQALAPAPAPQAVASSASARIRPLAEVEREAIQQALQAFAGNITHAARALGINASTIHRKMARWDGAGTVLGE